jgi:hypothetical protein
VPERGRTKTERRKKIQNLEVRELKLMKINSLLLNRDNFFVCMLRVVGDSSALPHLVVNHKEEQFRPFRTKISLLLSPLFMSDAFNDVSYLFSVI